ncbi:hypothetical protein [Pseudomonas sp. DSP3-2-2]|uniref:hypothetical protein n=1 Tax=unclassified Pseudomonas TaxID=196821 RepID=UPI003CEC2D8E
MLAMRLRKNITSSGGRRINDRFWPILLKKSAMVSTVEKYAFEIEIFTLSRGFRAQISRSGAQKRRFQRSVFGQSGRTDFFNSIGQKWLVALVSLGGYLAQLELARYTSPRLESARLAAMTVTVALTVTFIR